MPAAALVLLASVLWGTTGTFASFLPHTVSPLAVGSATMGIGGVLLFGVFARESWALFRMPYAPRWVALGAVSVFAYPLCFYAGMALGGVALGTVVSLGSAPMFSALLERVLDGTRLTRGWMLGTGLAVVGIVLLATGVSSGPSERQATSIPLAVVLALVAGLAYAAYSYALRRLMTRGAAPTAALGAMFGVGGVLLLPVLLVTGAPLVATGDSIAITGYLVMLPMYCAYMLFGYGLAKIPASFATTLSLAEPVVASVLALVVVHERLTAAGWLGLLLIVGGIAVAGRASIRQHAVPRLASAE